MTAPEPALVSPTERLEQLEDRARSVSWAWLRLGQDRLYVRWAGANLFSYKFAMNSISRGQALLILEGMVYP